MTEISLLAEKLRAFYLHTHRVIDQMAKTHGLSFARIKLLMFIQSEGPLRSADVVESFGQAPRTVTEALDALERDGLIRRDPDPLDRRAKRISLTDAGITAVKNAEPARHQFLNEVFGVLDSGETDDLARIMDKLNDHLQTLDKA